MYGNEVTQPPEISLKNQNAGVLLTVNVSGPCVVPAHLAKITEPFYRVNPSRTRTSGGVGIDIYLCKLFAEAHGGEFLIESELGQGVKVEI